MPETARTSRPPRVLAHKVIMLGRPIAAKSTDPESSASVSGAGPATVSHSTLTGSSPTALACFSIRC